MMFLSSLWFDKVLNLDFAWLIVLLEKFLFFHSTKISESGDGERVLPLFLFEGYLKLKVLELGFLSADISNHTFRWEFNVLNGVVFAIIDVNLNIVKTDIGTLSNFIIALEVSLKVIFWGTYSDFSWVFEYKGVLSADIEEERGSLKGSVVKLGLYVCVDESWDAGELHLKTIIARPIHNLTY